MVGTTVRLSYGEPSLSQEVQSGNNGQFSFTNVPSGPFRLAIVSKGFTGHTFSGMLAPRQVYIVPPIVLSVTEDSTEVWVRITPNEVAQAQIHEQEKQRVLGFIPNFYASYVHDAIPLSSKQKFHLAWKSTTDPFTPFGVAILAGIEQATNALEGYGQGADGYAKRFGASYADVAVGTFVGSAILPSLWKQDPRYFYKGTGSVQRRLIYAISSSVICKGDNGRWQPNYSNVAGAFAAGGVSYLYYPPSNRNGVSLLALNAAIRLGETSLEGILQEFLIPHLTPRVRKREQHTPRADRPSAGVDQ